MDIWFVTGFHMGVASVAWATFICQGISCILALLFVAKRLRQFDTARKSPLFSAAICAKILKVAVPSILQQSFISVGNIVIQGVINGFGPGVMAGYSAAVKLNNLVITSFTTLGNGISNYTAQNIGAGKTRRAEEGTRTTILLTLLITGVIAALIWIFSNTAVRLFSSDPDVISYGTLFLRTNIFSLLFNCITHVLAGSLRGRGDSRAPMVIMLIGFVLVRQIYLFIMAHYISNTPAAIGFGYPVGWMVACVLELLYYRFRVKSSYETSENQA
jgi:Na+-driven multidrug efflux pump